MMRFRRWAVWGVLSGILLVGLGGAGCANPSYSGSGGRPVGQTNEMKATIDRLYPGNRITIVFSGLPEPLAPHIEQIRDDGMITPPLLGKPVRAAGKSVGELQQELHDLYVPDIFVALTVTISLPERYFFVGGEVRKPGQHPVLTGMTVLKAIQAAGDFTDFADKSRVQITRADGTKETVNCKKALRNPQLDVPVYPEDRIDVPRGSGLWN